MDPATPRRKRAPSSGALPINSRGWSKPKPCPKIFSLYQVETGKFKDRWRDLGPWQGTLRKYFNETIYYSE